MIFELLFCLLLFVNCTFQSEFCTIDENDQICKESLTTTALLKQKRYLLYDVNPGEGFNLRRDVYMRIATLVKKLNQESKEKEWVLVLPPWGPLYHWKTKNIGSQSQIKWKKFFDITSLGRYVPVIELQDFLHHSGNTIDVLYYLQNYEEGWTDNTWEERVDVRDCIGRTPYHKTIKGTFTGWFWDYDDIFAKEFYCLSIQGYSSTLKRFLESTNARIVMIDRAEVILHDTFGDLEYWMVRRSMVFSQNLIEIGDEFRKLHFNSTDEQDATKLFESLDSPIARRALGGPYVAVHLRRRDFVQARPNDVPSIAIASQQILKHMKRLDISSLFVATDALEPEFKEILQYIPEAKRFIPSHKMLKNILDGGVAIVDQWICAHARFFIGSYESTFSFRIQEEREILGFPVESTFNRLCGNNQTTCSQPSKWKIVFL